MTVPGRPGPRDVGPRRIWLTAILFGLVSSLVLGAIVVLATRSSDDGSGAMPAPTGGAGTVAGPVDDPARGSDEEVALVGDSITSYSEKVLEQRLSGQWSLVIDGRPGATVAEQLGPAADAATRQPSQVVVNLGTNDVARGNDAATSVASLRRMLDLFPSARCLHVVTVHEGMEVDGTVLAGRAADYNRHLRDLAATDPRVSVIEWDDALAAAEADGAAPLDLLYDTVHPGDRGKQVLAERYAEALASCPAA